jgi:hypothetical protein
MTGAGPDARRLAAMLRPFDITPANRRKVMDDHKTVLLLAEAHLNDSRKDMDELKTGRLLAEAHLNDSPDRPSVWSRDGRFLDADEQALVLAASRLDWEDALELRRADLAAARVAMGLFTDPQCP